MKNNDFDAQDELEEVEYPQDGLRWMSVVVLLLVVSGFLSLAWYAYHSEVSTSKSDAEVPLIEADNKSFKEKPKDPGGMEIQHQDKLVYGAVSKDAATASPTVEHLLPDAEEAIIEPHAPDTNAPDKVADAKAALAKIEEDQKTKTWVKEQDKSKPVVADADPSEKNLAEKVTAEKTEPTKTEPVEVKAVNVEEKGNSAPEEVAKTVEPSAEKTTEKPAEKSIEKVAEKPAPTEWKAADVKKAEAAKANNPALASEVKPVAKPATKPVKYGKAGVEDLIVAQADKYNNEKSAKPVAKSLSSSVKSTGGGNGAYMAQVASLRSHADANATWRTLQGKYSVLKNMNYKIDTTNIAGKGTYYRLRVTGFNNASAVSTFCKELQIKGQACMPVK